MSAFDPSGGAGSPFVPAHNPVPSEVADMPDDYMPALPEGYHWQRPLSGGTPIPMRDTRVRSHSVDYRVDAHDLGDGRLGVIASMADPTPVNPGNRAQLSSYAEVARSGGTYTGDRRYPMSSADYTTVAGDAYDRGHGVDHADGTAVTTSDPVNFTPEPPDFNRGARNHFTQSLRRDQRREARAGGSGQARYVARFPEPGPTSVRTSNGRAVPEHEDFLTVDTGGATSHHRVPFAPGAYTGRRRSSAAPFEQPPGSWAPPDIRLATAAAAPSVSPDPSGGPPGDDGSPLSPLVSPGGPPVSPSPSGTGAFLAPIVAPGGSSGTPHGIPFSPIVTPGGPAGTPHSSAASDPFASSAVPAGPPTASHSLGPPTAPGGPFSGFHPGGSHGTGGFGSGGSLGGM